LQIEAYEANLEDMYIKDGIKDGIENIRMRDSRVEGNYYISPSCRPKNIGVFIF